MKQIALFKNSEKAYGGELLKTRKGRAQPRPLATRHDMHLVLRSSLARGEWSFRRPRNARRIRVILEKFARRYGVRLISLANVGNHLHIHLRLGSRHTYPAFIRAVTGSIAMAVTGASRWNKRSGQRPKSEDDSSGRRRFWDYRPFTRVVIGFQAALRLKDYLKINRLEGIGYARPEARFFIAWEHARGRPV
jgi:REP element-mobilizing transposase RayT